MNECKIPVNISTRRNELENMSERLDEINSDFKKLKRPNEDFDEDIASVKEIKQMIRDVESLLKD